MLGRLLGARYLLPDHKGPITGGAVLDGGYPMTARAEPIVDRNLSRENMLGMIGGFKLPRTEETKRNTNP